MNCPEAQGSETPIVLRYSGSRLFLLVLRRSALVRRLSLLVRLPALLVRLAAVALRRACHLGRLSMLH